MCFVLAWCATCRRRQGVSDYFAQLPGVDNPEIFGMHENANVTFNTNESLGLMHTVSEIFNLSESHTGVSLHSGLAQRAGIMPVCMLSPPISVIEQKSAGILGRIHFHDAMNTGGREFGVILYLYIVAVAECKARLACSEAFLLHRVIITQC